MKKAISIPVKTSASRNTITVEQYMYIFFFQLTSKNIQCMRTLLNLAHCHGAVLGTSWQLVLATLQVYQEVFMVSDTLLFRYTYIGFEFLCDQ